MDLEDIGDLYQFDQLQDAADEPEEENEDIPEQDGINEQIILQNPLISVRETITVPTLPEYPSTAPHGVATVVYTRGMTDEMVDDMLESTVQYGYNRGTQRQIRRVNCPYLGDVECSLYSKLCSGIKFCRYARPELLNIRVQVMDDRLEADLNTLNDVTRDDGPYFDLNQRVAQFGNKILHEFAEGKACRNVQLQGRDGCSPITLESRDRTGSLFYLVACNRFQINRDDPNHAHFQTAVPPDLRPRIALLQSMFAHDVRPEDHQPCCTVFTKRARRKFCFVPHPQGRGEMQETDCNVSFHIIRPTDLNATPFVILVSYGTHLHPPPPAERMPRHFMKELNRKIADCDDPYIGGSALLNNRTVERHCMGYGGRIMSDCHPSATNTDRIRALTARRRKVLFPHGREFPGLLREYELNHRRVEDAYIKYLWIDGTDWMFICGYKQSIELIGAQFKYLQIDMSYKRVRDKRIKEIVWAVYDSSMRKVMTLLRFFTNTENANTYRYMFHMADMIRKRLFGTTFRWQYLHKEGIVAVVMDMDFGQLSGLGQYLIDIDPGRRTDKVFHIRNVVRFCKIHFIRGIERIVVRGTEASLRNRMIQLREAQTQDQYFELLNSIVALAGHRPEISNWVRHKGQPLISAGLCRAFSFIEESHWQEMRAETNAAEQTHAKVNSMGRKRTLCEAVSDYNLSTNADNGFSSSRMDKNDLNQWINHRGITRTRGTHTWRNRQPTLKRSKFLGFHYENIDPMYTDPGPDSDDNPPPPPPSSDIQTPHMSSSSQLINDELDDVALLECATSSGNHPPMLMKLASWKNQRPTIKSRKRAKPNGRSAATSSIHSHLGALNGRVTKPSSSLRPKAIVSTSISSMMIACQ